MLAQLALPITVLSCRVRSNTALFKSALVRSMSEGTQHYVVQGRGSGRFEKKDWGP